jgi:hypothetical protein
MPVAIDTSHSGFWAIQKIATIQVSSGFIRGIPGYTNILAEQRDQSAMLRPSGVGEPVEPPRRGGDRQRHLRRDRRAYPP